MSSPERAERLKMTDAAGAELKRRTTELLRISHPNRLDLDTTDLQPEHAAQAILSHAKLLVQDAEPLSRVEESKVNLAYFRF